MRGIRCALAGAVALAAVTAAGCDWLKGSGGSSRVTPFLSDIGFSRTTMLCGQEFEVSFSYDDPQEDISLLSVSFQHAASTARRDRQTLWEDGSDLNLQSPARAVYTFAFACSDPGGRWVVEVQVEDLRGHVSNVIRGEVSLASAVR